MNFFVFVDTKMQQKRVEKMEKGLSGKANGYEREKEGHE